MLLLLFFGRKSNIAFQYFFSGSSKQEKKTEEGHLAQWLSYWPHWSRETIVRTWGGSWAGTLAGLMFRSGSTRMGIPDVKILKFLWISWQMASAQRRPPSAAPAFLYVLPNSSSTQFPMTQQWNGLHNPVPTLQSKGINDQKKVSTISTFAFASFPKLCYTLSYWINFFFPLPFVLTM